MNLFEQIDKLINERGSANILRERIAMLKDEFSVLSRHLVDCKREAAVLTVQQKKLHAHLEENAAIIADLKNRNEALEKKLLDHDNLQLKYGVYWDKNGTPHCPRCKSPISLIVWATYLNQQVRALACHCSSQPIILMENGAPIQAPDAMESMAN